MLEILAVEPGSIAEELELQAGDVLLAVNDKPLRDQIDFQVYTAVEDLVLEVRRKDGEMWELELEKDAFEPLGLHFEHPDPTQCGNNCIFCFVHQLPRGLRRTLYVKDEDYRFSYLYGSYVTLTNISDADMERIIEQRLSPLYVSVHATDEELRARLIGRQGPPVLDLLERLTAAGIEVHTQIVLCPGFNDGAQLERTIGDLYALHPGIRTLAVVPVGLTGYRERLPQLRPLDAAGAAAVLETLHRFQERYLAETGTRFVFAADELYLKAGVEFPPLEAYEELSQVENGVGLIPVFRADAVDVLLEARKLRAGAVSTFTGASASGELTRFAADLAAKTGVKIHLHTIRNDFFGGEVTVAGLIAGADLIAQLQGKELGEALLVPDVVLRDGEDVFLDDLTLPQVAQALGVAVFKIDSTPWGLLEGLEELFR
jgi:putative radical SAM enzyme (TIGR03279 family)